MQARLQRKSPSPGVRPANFRPDRGHGAAGRALQTPNGTSHAPQTHRRLFFPQYRLFFRQTACGDSTLPVRFGSTLGAGAPAMLPPGNTAPDLSGAVLFGLMRTGRHG